ncbi:PREDICTED: uncharacterized protein C7orf50 homolog [Ceratosolen solmsi marchali]|uniref:Uncharacterized protein C7orf50 homolog n=1 Tax=Ceratosolen solmsi marchali TaxID=326594 RepID=A0AAJ6YQE3_9HYME|nr:PREDICTED: uncharacterized protein C7orf50 homolog [Ceratosolen solmsi marchali]
MRIKKKELKDLSNITQSNEEKVDKDNTDVKKNEPSKRQLKKEKAEVRALEAKEANKQVIAQKALNYVSQWKHVRNEWKFEKLKQIWLMDNLLNVKYVPDKSFTIILEYFEGCVGSAKKQLVNKAMEVVKKLEDKIKNDEIEETIEYKRARQLLQTLPIET